MAVERTELTDQLIYGIDFKSRRIHFGAGLDHGVEDSPTSFSDISVEMAVRAIHKMEQEAANKPIEIHMNSFGGDVHAMLYLHDVILHSPCQFKFYGGGAIMSCATFIMACCDERYLYPNTRVMVHEFSSGSDPIKHSDIQIDAREGTKLHDIMCDIYAANSRLPKDFWSDIAQKDVFMSASEAVSMGLADKVIEYKKRGNLRKMRQHQMKKDIDLQGLVSDIYDRIGRKKVPRVEVNQFVKELSDPNVIIDNTEKPAESSLPPAAEKSDEVKS